MAVSLHRSNIIDITVSMHKITDAIKILITPISAAESMIPDSFHCYQLHLETLVVSEQRCILTREYAKTCETNQV